MKIKMELQVGPECALATLAALTGKPYAEVRSRACKIAGVETWQEIAEGQDPVRFWRSLRTLGIELGVARLVDTWTAYSVAPTASRIPGKGRGSVMIKRIADGTVTRHVMAYQDGLVYDPNEPNHPAPLDRILRRWPGYFLEQIDPLVEDYRSWTCPVCGAPSGKACHYPSGYVFSQGHSARRKLTGG